MLQYYWCKLMNKTFGWKYVAFEYGYGIYVRKLYQAGDHLWVYWLGTHTPISKLRNVQYVWK